MKPRVSFHPKDAGCAAGSRRPLPERKICPSRAGQDGPPRESRPRSGPQFRCPLELAQGLYGVPVAKESQNVTAIVLQDGKWDFTHTGTHTLAWDRSPHFLHGLANMRNVM